MANIAEAVVNYFKDAKVELTKVSWPTRKTTIRYSALVITGSIAVAACFALMDFGLNKGLDLLVTVTR